MCLIYLIFEVTYMIIFETYHIDLKEGLCKENRDITYNHSLPLFKTNKSLYRQLLKKKYASLRVWETFFIEFFVNPTKDFLLEYRKIQVNKICK